ncbi:MAG: tetratricopeptide repeat protein [Deltaproteobacteria bacterium]|nr:MAG: tetratricopeptide repeat protein [Deltaproteobacteria bacterium]
MAPVSLGAFTLHGPLAEGGMGVVWRGVHTEHRVPVAVKVLAPHAWRRRDLLEQFRNEVRAVARLDHPGIVMVLDHDTITPEASEASQGRLAVGSPYLVMEYASAGTLGELGRSLPWPELRSVLLAMLDALAHAHARGVVHRDIKPGNVLLCTADDLRPGIKLTDWGIAHAVNWTRGRRATERAGTLHFMAPEQVRGDWRAQGPWTDLYALGCLAYRLAAGRLPFAGLRGDALAAAQCHEQPPPLAPRMPVGSGFAAWVTCLMAKDPADRFPRAAEAAQALRVLHDPPPRPKLVANTPTMSGRLVIPGGTTLEIDALAELAGPVVPSYGEGQALPASRIGFPPDWRSPSPPPPAPALVGAGLSLWGLRAIPLIGREAERDQLWSTLGEVHESGEVRALVLEGPSGMGKSAISRWLTQRAHEVGGAHVVRAVQGEGESPDAGLRRALARALRVEGLRGEALRERLATTTPPEELDALARVLADENEVEVSALERRLRARERRSAIVEALRRHGRGQPVLLVLEDVQWSDEAISLTRELLIQTVDRPFPLLALLTARSEALAMRPVEAELLAELGAPRMVVGPLPQTAHVQLIRHLLDLDESLVARIEQLTEGSPLFVIQLVDEWVRRGLLVPSARGLQLRGGAQPELPDDLHATWARQADEVLDGLPGVARCTLERAVVLGAVVDSEEWATVCRTDLDPDDELASETARDVLRRRLINRRLAREDGGSLAFTHSLFREAVVRICREEGRYQSHHKAAAKMLRTRSANPTGELAERIGLHALEAGDLATALPPLLEAVEERRHRTNYRSALALVHRLEQALDEAHVAASDPHRGELALRATVLHRLQGDYRGAAARAQALREDCMRHGWPDREVDAMLELATVRLHTDRVEEGRSLAEEVIRRCRPDHPTLSNALYIAAAAAGEARDFEAQEAYHREGAEVCKAMGDEVGWADCQRDRGNHYLRRGDYDTAEPLFAQALPVYESRGLRLGIAHTVNGLAEIARKRGDLETAEAGYTRSIRLFESIGGGQATVPMLNLGLVRLARGAWGEAREVVEQSLARLQRQGRGGLVAAAHALLLPTYAAAGDWADWDRAIGRLRKLLDETGMVARDLAWALEKAGDVAVGAGDVVRARRARRLARRQYEALGDQAGIQRMVQPVDG